MEPDYKEITKYINAYKIYLQHYNSYIKKEPENKYKDKMLGVINKAIEEVELLQKEIEIINE